MTAQQVAKKLKTLTNYNYNISLQNGKEAGQTVFHVNLHICPVFVPGAKERSEETGVRSEEDMAA